MRVFKAQIRPLSAFGTLPKGDTLFGQLCWAVRYRLGESRLIELLEGYTQGQPFAVLSDAFPLGYLPRPALPGHWFRQVPGEDRKQVKKRVWLLCAHFNQEVTDWLKFCRMAQEVPGGAPFARPQPHNSINRQTGTTGQGFAPYAMTQYWFDGWDEERNQPIEAKLEVYCLLDETRLDRQTLAHLLADIGTFGFGRDASIGLGKFQLEGLDEIDWPCQEGANAYVTLAPCAPQGLGFVPERSFYQVFTRFGRHGDVAVLSGRPFKNPVLLAQTGAVLTPHIYEPRQFVGQGLGGHGLLSKAIEETVHQGYAPTIGIRLLTREAA